MSVIRHRFLSIAFTLSLLLLFESFLARLLITIISIIYHYPFMKKYTFILLLFLLYFCWHIHHEIVIMNDYTLRIDEIRSNYVIASNGSNKCILYNVNGASLLDIIEVEGKYESISANKNRNTFQFDTYLKHKHVDSSMYVKSYKTIRKSKHVKAKLYDYVNQIDDEEIKTYLNKVFYRVNEEQQEYAYFIYASGMHVSFVILLLSKILKKDYHKIAVITAFTLMMLLPIAAYMQRILVFSMIALLFTNYHKREQLGISMIVMYWLNPSIIYEISFIIPITFRLIMLFDMVKLSLKLKQLLVLFPIQLYFFHECNLSLLLLFPLFRMLSGIAFLCSLSCLFLEGMYPILKLIIFIQEQLLSFLPYAYKIVGKPYLVWMLIWISMCILYITYGQRKQQIVLLVLVVIHCNMKVLTPFGEITYIDQTTPNMIQRISGIFERNSLISKEI